LAVRKFMTYLFQAEFRRLRAVSSQEVESDRRDADETEIVFPVDVVVGRRSDLSEDCRRTLHVSRSSSIWWTLHQRRWVGHVLKVIIYSPLIEKPTPWARIAVGKISEQYV